MDSGQAMRRVVLITLASACAFSAVQTCSLPLLFLFRPVMVS